MSTDDGRIGRWRPGAGRWEEPWLSMDVRAPVTSVDVAAREEREGLVLAAGGREQERAGAGRVRAWRLRGAGAEPIVQASFPSEVLGVGLRPDGGRLAVATAERLWVYGLEGAGEARQERSLPGASTGPLYTADGRWMLVGLKDGRVLVLDGRLREVGRLDGGARVTALARLGADIMAGDQVGTVRIWRARPDGSFPPEPAVVAALQAKGEAAITALAAGPRGEVLVAVGDRTLRRLRFAPETVEPEPVVAEAGAAPAFGPTGALYVATPRRIARQARPRAPLERVVDLTRGLDAAQAGESGLNVHRLAISPTGAQLALARLSGQLEAWDLRQLRQRWQAARTNKMVHGLDFLGETVVSASHGGVVSLGDFTRIPASPPQSLSVSGEDLFAYGEWGGSLTVARRTAGAWSFDVSRHHGGKGTMVALAPNGRALASGGNDGRVRLWPLDGEAAPDTPLSRHPAAVVGLAWQPGRQVVASLDDAGDLYFASAGEPLPADQPERLTVVGDLFAFSPDGDRLVTRSPAGVAVHTLSTEALARRACARARRDLSDAEQPALPAGLATRVCDDAAWTDCNL
ncbi:MAG: hypothetical protein R3F60_20925 [bacterium]